MSRERFVLGYANTLLNLQSAVFVKYNCLDIRKLNVLTLNSCQGSTPFTKGSGCGGGSRVRNFPPLPLILKKLEPG